MLMPPRKTVWLDDQQLAVIPLFTSNPPSPFVGRRI